MNHCSIPRLTSTYQQNPDLSLNFDTIAIHAGLLHAPWHVDMTNTVRKKLLIDRPHCVRIFDAIAVQTKQQQPPHTNPNLNSSTISTQGRFL